MKAFLYNAGIKISVNVMMEILLRHREGQNAYSAQEHPMTTVPSSASQQEQSTVPVVHFVKLIGSHFNPLGRHPNSSGR